MAHGHPFVPLRSLTLSLCCLLYPASNAHPVPLFSSRWLNHHHHHHHSADAGRLLHRPIVRRQRSLYVHTSGCHIHSACNNYMHRKLVRHSQPN
ncbi:hypothetical protein LZ31DRAFT_307544 [Colletotrichum somersetense]|nr:hypothetical protein LZ31DRAFT_307544 [Colletotrichum somersetense]